MTTYPAANVTAGKSLPEMIEHIVGLRRIQGIWLEQQRACDPVSKQWFEFEQHFNNACDLEIDYQLDLTMEMLGQGIEYVEDRAGRSYAAMACIVGHSGSLYAHVGENPDATAGTLRSITSPVAAAGVRSQARSRPRHTLEYEDLLRQRDGLLRAAQAVLDDREVQQVISASNESRHTLRDLSDAVQEAEAAASLEVGSERCA